MANPIYGFSSSDIERISRVLTAFEASDIEQPPQIPTRRPIGRTERIFGILEGAAAATTALTSVPKSATLSEYSFTSTNGTTDTGVDHTVWNFAPQAATTDRWTYCSRHSRTGKWLIDYQACS